MVYTDVARRVAFRKAIFQICDSSEPTRSHLREVGREAAMIAGRATPWSGGHLYALINWERLSCPWKYGIHPQLFDVVMKLAGMEAMNGKRAVKVYAGRVKEGAVILAASRRCARARCGVHFVPVTPNQRYCCSQCAERIATFRRKNAIRQRQRRKRRNS